MDAGDREAVARARAYPFHRAALGPAFTLGGGWAGAGPALVAFGANASRAVLEAKLGPGARLSAVPASLIGFDVVYSAHVSPHGAIPATLAPSPATSVAVMVLRLAPAALRALDATEPNYVRAALADGVHAYGSRHGSLRLDGREHALADVCARGRTLAELTETQMLERVRVLLDPGADGDAFVLAGVRDEAARAARTRALRALAGQR